MSEKKTTPLFHPPARRHCPVCGQVSYSLSGEHPQCALLRGDAVFRAKLKLRNAKKLVRSAPK